MRWRPRWSGRTTQERSVALLARITPTADAADFAGVDCDRGGFETRSLPRCSARRKTSSVSTRKPWDNTDVADHRPRHAPGGREDFIDPLLSSPVDKMPLVEIKGEKTSDEALAWQTDHTCHRQDPLIVVNDSRGFFHLAGSSTRRLCDAR